MIMPTPVNELPSFTGSGNEPSQPGSNQWLKFIIVGSVLVLAIGISIAANRKMQQNLSTLNSKSDEREND